MVRSLFRRFLRIVPKVACFETERSTRGTSVAQRSERMAPKCVCFESLKSDRAPLQQKKISLGSCHHHQVGKMHGYFAVICPQVGNIIHFMPYKMSEPSVVMKKTRFWRT